MKILITGNMGYVGPPVVARLRETHPGATLVGLDIGYYGHCVTGAEVLPECRVDTQVFADIRRFPKTVLRGVTAVVHLAGISNDPIGNRFERATLEINYRSTVELARAAKRAGAASFVFASSCSLYGSADAAPRTESSAINPLTAYARSKALAERELESLGGDGFCVTCLRFSTACGWSDRLRLDLVLNDFVASAVSAGRITILSDGKPWRPLIHVRDMARAVEWALSREASRGGPFLAVNIGSDDWNFQVRDLADAVAAAIPGTAVSLAANAQPDRRSYRVNFGLFRKLAPEHQPQTFLADAIEELRDGLRRIRFRDPSFRSSRHMRLEVLTELQGSGLLNENLEWMSPPEANRRERRREEMHEAA